MFPISKVSEFGPGGEGGQNLSKISEFSEGFGVKHNWEFFPNFPISFSDASPNQGIHF